MPIRRVLRINIQATINQVTTLALEVIRQALTHFSSLKIRAKKRMNRITVDLDIVYSVTVMYCRLQFDMPMSAAEAMPSGATFFK